MSDTLCPLLTCAVQDLMKGAADITNVVAACTVEGRQERLEAMLQQLELCEKALQVRPCSAAQALAGLPPGCRA